MDAASAAFSTVEDLLGEAATAVHRGSFHEPFYEDSARALQTAVSESELLRELAQSLKLRATLNAVLYCDVDNGQQPTDAFTRLDEGAELAPEMLGPLRGLCAEACQQGVTQIGSATDGFSVPAAVVPIPRGTDGGTEALCALVDPQTSETPSRIAEMLQLAAVHVVVWQTRDVAERAEQEARASAALLELTHRLESSDDLRGGCLALANGLQSFIGCQRVAIGVSRGNSRHCRLQALSGFACFDKQADTATAVEAALDEALLLNEIVRWPSDQFSRRTPARTHEQLVTTLGADLVLSVPLHDAHGQPAGVCLLVNPPSAEIEAVTKFMRAAGEPLGTSVRWLQRSRGGPLARFRRRLARAAK